MLWIVIAVLLAGTLAFLVLPLMRRPASESSRDEYDIKVFSDQLAEVDRDMERGVLSGEQAKAARTEVERRMLAVVPESGVSGGGGAANGKAAAGPGSKENLFLIGVLAVLLPLGAMSLYLSLGSPNVPDFPMTAERADALAKEANRNAEIERMIETLAKRMEERPGDIRGWQLLGRSYAARKQYDKAAYAYGRAYKIDSNPDMTVSYAEALTLDADGTVTDKARALFVSAVKADPVNPTARFYLGLKKVQAGDLAGAIQDWTDLAAMSPQDAPWIKILDSRIDNAARRLGIDPATIKPTPEAFRLAESEAKRLAKAKASAQAASRPAPPAGASGPSREQVEAAALMSDEERRALVRTMVKRLAAKMKANPGNREGWLRLGRAYEVLGEKQKAEDALRRAKALAQ